MGVHYEHIKIGLRPLDEGYRSRLVEAFADLLVREGRTDIDYTEITRRMEATLMRAMRSQTVGRWLREFVQPRDPAERKAFARALGVTTDWLFYGEVEGAKPNRTPRPPAEEVLAEEAERETAAKRAGGRNHGSGNG
jgi:hypothetical protein